MSRFLYLLFRMAAALLFIGSMACSSPKSTPTAPAEAPPREAAAAMGMDRGSRASPTERADRQTAYLTERLSLRSDQVDPVRDIALEYAKRGAELRQRSQGDRRAMMQGMRELQSQQDAAYKSVLDATQYAELQEVREEVRDAMRDRMQERRASGGRRRG